MRWDENVVDPNSRGKWKKILFIVHAASESYLYSYSERWRRRRPSSPVECSNIIAGWEVGNWRNLLTCLAAVYLVMPSWTRPTAKCLLIQSTARHPWTRHDELNSIWGTLRCGLWNQNFADEWSCATYIVWWFIYRLCLSLCPWNEICIALFALTFNA